MGTAEGTRGDTGIAPRSQLPGGGSGAGCRVTAARREVSPFIGRVLSLSPVFPPCGGSGCFSSVTPRSPARPEKIRVIFSSVYLSCTSRPGKKKNRISFARGPSSCPAGSLECCVVLLSTSGQEGFCGNRQGLQRTSRNCKEQVQHRVPSKSSPYLQDPKCPSCWVWDQCRPCLGVPAFPSFPNCLSET